MQHAPQFDISLVNNLRCFFLSKPPDGYEPIWLYDRDDLGQVLVAQRFEWLRFNRRQLVWCTVSATSLKESQRAIVHDKVIGKKCFWPAKLLGKKAPKPAAANFTSLAIIPKDGATGMFMCRLGNRRIYAQPVSHSRHLTERHTDLYHSIRPRIHAEKQYAFDATAVKTKVLLVRRPSVVKRIVYTLNRRTETELINRVAQFRSRGNKRGSIGSYRHTRFIVTPHRLAKVCIAMDNPRGYDRRRPQPDNYD